MIAEMGLQHCPTLKWEGARDWVACCAAIPTFAFIVKFEILKKGFTGTEEDHYCFAQLEKFIFKMYSATSPEARFSIDTCLPLIGERREVYSAIGVESDALVDLSLIFGIIFPNRSHLYQVDWANGLAPSNPCAPAEYAAMRFAADLTGITTPQSLVGRTAAELKINAFGSAHAGLTEMAFQYMEQTKDLKSWM